MDQRALILDLAMNLTRIGNWVADDYRGKENRIEMFLTQVKQQLKELKPLTLPKPVKQALTRCQADFQKFQTAKESVSRDPLAWAESFLTWGNILTHRAQLI